MLFSFNDIHSTRLFPKGSGPDGYEITGIAALCDWKLISDVDGSVKLYTGNISQPRTIFISLRGGIKVFKYFEEEVLPKLISRVVLVSGSEDITLPRQVDCRYSPFNHNEKALLERIRCDQRVLVWFAENLDLVLPKMKPIPTGYVFGGSGAPVDYIEVSDIPLEKRNRRAFCCHRQRDGDQWSARKMVSELCRSKWKQHTTFVENEIPLVSYMDYIRAHPFSICVEGGGLDPSPKAWLSLALGSIPIMRRSATTEIYAETLPVAIVESWNSQSITPELMDNWIEQLSPWFKYSEMRKELEFRLSKTYWWNKIKTEFTIATGTPY